MKISRKFEERVFILNVFLEWATSCWSASLDRVRTTFDPGLQHGHECTAEQYLCRVVDQQWQSNGAEVLCVAKHYLQNRNTCKESGIGDVGQRGIK